MMLKIEGEREETRAVENNFKAKVCMHVSS
jgi:hypothetical protein